MSRTVQGPNDPPSPRGAQGRADLLWALALADGDRACEDAFGTLLGFERKPEERRDLPGGAQSDSHPTGTAERGFVPTTVTPQPTVPLVFQPYRLVSVETAATDAQWQPRPNATAATERLSTADQAPWDAQALVPALPPLVRWTRLWPRLRAAVGEVRDGCLDAPKLVQSLAQGRAIRRLPRRRRLAMPADLPVVMDFSERLTPYWEDWHALARRLARCWPHAVRLRVLQGPPTQPLQRWQSGAPPAVGQPWPKLPAKSTLLIFSDLGMVDAAHPWPGECWAGTLQAYRRRGVRAVVLAPISREHVQPRLVNAARVVRLSPDSDLRVLSRRPLGAGATAAAPHPLLETLLAMVALATLVEPPLLRALRECLPDAAGDAGLEGELWCHPELDTDALGCALAPWAVERRRRQFECLPDPLQRATLECLRRWHAGLPQLIHHEETLLWRHLAKAGEAEADNADRARALFTRLRNTLDGADRRFAASGTRERLIQLADRHVHWLAGSLGPREAYLSELASAVARAAPQAAAALADGIDPIVWLRDRPAREPQPLAIRQTADRHLRLVDPAEADPDTKAAGNLLLGRVRPVRDAVLWGVEQSDGTISYRAWPWESDHGQAPRLPTPLQLVDPAHAGDDAPAPVRHSPRLPAVFIHTGRERLRFEPTPMPVWASRMGQDRFGLYAELSVPTRRDGITTKSRVDVSSEIGVIVQRFRWITPGRFLMGSPRDELERESFGYDETQHPVTLTQGYWLADTACTQELWMAVMGNNPSGFKDDPENPVENVSWTDVQEFLSRLNGLVPGLDARLPTEAEWEYACRAGTTTPFSFGANITPEQVNYRGDYPYANGKKGLYREKTVPVRSLPANPWGLYEMHGNVWEWCEDWFADYPAGEAVDPAGPPDGALRVLRGGSWFDFGGDVRSACRHAIDPGYRNDRIGFRFAPGGKGASGPAGE